MKIIIAGLYKTEGKDAEWARGLKPYNDLLVAKQCHKIETEQEMRKLLWEEIKMKAESGDWVLTVDSDETLTTDFLRMRKMLEALPKEVDIVSCRMIDLWDKDNYRVDGLWSSYDIRLVKYEPTDYTALPFEESLKGTYGGKLPLVYYNKKVVYNSDFRILNAEFVDGGKREEKKWLFNKHVNNKDWLMREHLLTVNGIAELKPLQKEEMAWGMNIIVDKEEGLENIKKSWDKWHERCKINYCVSKTVFEKVQQYMNDNGMEATLTPMFQNLFVEIVGFLKKSSAQYEFIIMLDNDFDEGMIYHLLNSERDFAIDAREGPLCAMLSKRAIEKILLVQLMEGFIPEKLCCTAGIIGWTMGRGMPMPIKKTLAAKFENKIPPFESAGTSVNPYDYVVK